MRDHDDELLLRDFADEVHNLHRSRRIQRSCRLVGKQNFRLVDERARNRDALALPARKLIRLFVVLPGEPHAVQSALGALYAFRLSKSGNGEREFDVPEHGLVGNEVIALKDEPDSVIPIDVPVAVAELFGAPAVDKYVARGVLIESPDDVEQGGFAAPGRTEHGHELVLSKGKVDALERLNGGIRHPVILGNLGKS